MIDLECPSLLSMMDPGNIMLNCLLDIGPPLTPRPKFHVVNATDIEVHWDKPFALPEFDVRN